MNRSGQGEGTGCLEKKQKRGFWGVNEKKGEEGFHPFLLDCERGGRPRAGLFHLFHFESGRKRGEEQRKPILVLASRGRGSGNSRFMLSLKQFGSFSFFLFFLVSYSCMHGPVSWPRE